jgi:predicted  nucleic acid-binding Zn-ribbon protein
VAKDDAPEDSGASFKRVPVIQSLLFFGFGFLSALLLALLVAPSFWRRATRLTERRIQATLPLTMNEIQAEKDALRAEFAMATRRLEMKVKELKDRVASQMVEIERGRQQLQQTTEERDRLLEEGGALGTKNAELEAALKASSDQLETISRKLDEITAQVEGKDAEISRLDMAATDANLEVSNRQIELVARETEIAKLKGDLTRLREQRRESEEKLRQTGIDNKSGREALKAERARANELERRLERALATVADREEALERRERELARLRENSDKPADTAETAPVPETGNIGEAAAGRSALSPENGEVPAATAALPERQEALARLAAERKRLEERLTTLTRENRRLRTASLSAPEPAPAAAPRPGEMALREQIGNLAAEMVALTALIEGPDSPIDKALAAPEAALPGGPPSLAERVRALREAAARRQ